MNSPKSPLYASTVGHLDAARAVLAHDADALDEIAALRARLDEPMRIAIAGAVKSGKSTLLNALVAEEIASTDATECTRLVTWYCDGDTPSVSMVHTDGGTRTLPMHRGTHQLHVDLGTTPEDDIARIQITWPSTKLGSYTIIDTPGTASVSAAVSERTARALTPDGDQRPAADAVVYLMRNVRPEDLTFLRDVRTHLGGFVSDGSVIGVLSRIDELDGGQMSALAFAQRRAAELTRTPELAEVCHSVLPVAGLVALRAVTLRHDEFEALAALARVDNEVFQSAMLSAARFTAPQSSLPLPQPTRAALVERFGMFGVRLSVIAILTGADTAAELAAELRRRSGLDELLRTIDAVVGQPAQESRCRTALVGLLSLLADRDDEAARVGSDVRHVLADDHAFIELLMPGRGRGASTQPLSQNASMLRPRSDRRACAR